MVEASRETPRDRVSVAWQRANGSIAPDVTVPPFMPAVLRILGQSIQILSSGHQQIVSASVQ